MKLVVVWLCRLLTGLKITDLSSAKEAMRRLLETGVKTVVISSTDLGSQSTLLALASTVTGNRFNSFNQLVSVHIDTGRSLGSHVRVIVNMSLHVFQ